MKRLFLILASVMMAAGVRAQDGIDDAFPIFFLLMVILGIAIWIGCIYLTYKMAKNRYRDPALWIILAFITSPFVAWIALLIAGEDELRKRQYEELERERSNN